MCVCFCVCVCARVCVYVCSGQRQPVEEGGHHGCDTGVSTQPVLESYLLVSATYSSTTFQVFSFIERRRTRNHRLTNKETDNVAV